MTRTIPISIAWQTTVLLRLTLATGAGAVSVFGFVPYSLLVFVPVAYATLLLCLIGLSTRAAFLVGWCFGMAQFGFGISWIADSFFVDADRFGTVAIPAVASLSAFLAVFPGFAAAVFVRLSTRYAVTGAHAALLLATCWTGAEWLRGHVLTGFPWNLAGYAFVDYAALRQPAAWFGSYGLSFLAVFAGALPATAVAATVRVRWSSLAVFIAMAALLYGFGISRLASPAPEVTGVELRIVQGNIPQQQKWGPGSRDRTLARYLDLSGRPGGFDVLLWPETAFPGSLDEEWPLASYDTIWHNQNEDHWARNATKTVCMDVDGDGKAEVFTSHSEKSGYPVARYDYEAGVWQKQVILTTLPAAHNLQVADMDNDGSFEVLTGVNRHRAVGIADETGAAMPTDFPVLIMSQSDGQWEGQVINNDGSYNLLVGDLEGDGDTDIIRWTSHDRKDMWLMKNRWVE